MTLENDLLKEMVDRVKFQNYITHRYLEEQLKQARKTPGITKLTTFNLLNPVSPSPTALQIVPKNDQRESVAITNAAGDDCLIAEEYFDPTTILQYFQDAALSVGTLSRNVAIPIGFLIAGNSVSLEGTTGIWAYGLGSNLATPVSTTLSIADSVYASKGPKPGDGIAELHMQELHDLELPGGGATT